MITSPSDYLSRMEAIQAGLQVGKDYETPSNLSSIYQANGNLFELDDKTRENILGGIVPRDIEGYYAIDLTTRSINPVGDIDFGVIKDHNVETILFVMDRYFDEHDLSKSEWIPVIQYRNTVGKEYWYKIPKIEIFGTDEDMIVFGWTLSNYVTAGAGQVTFSIRFYQADSKTEYIAKQTKTFELTNFSDSTITNGKAYSINQITTLYNTYIVGNSTYILKDGTYSAGYESIEAFLDKFFTASVSAVINYELNTVATKSPTILSSLDIGDEESSYSRASDLESLLADYLKAVESIDKIVIDVNAVNDKIDKNLADAIQQQLDAKIKEIDQGYLTIKEYLRASENDRQMIESIKDQVVFLTEKINKEDFITNLENSYQNAIKQIDNKKAEYLKLVGDNGEAFKKTLDDLASTAEKRMNNQVDEFTNKATQTIAEFNKWLSDTTFDEALNTSSTYPVQNVGITKGIISKGKIFRKDDHNLGELDYSFSLSKEFDSYKLDIMFQVIPAEETSVTDLDGIILEAWGKVSGGKQLELLKRARLSLKDNTWNFLRDDPQGVGDNFELKSERVGDLLKWNLSIKYAASTLETAIFNILTSEAEPTQFYIMMDDPKDSINSKRFYGFASPEVNYKDGQVVTVSKTTKLNLYQNSNSEMILRLDSETGWRPVDINFDNVAMKEDLYIEGKSFKEYVDSLDTTNQILKYIGVSQEDIPSEYASDEIFSAKEYTDYSIKGALGNLVDDDGETYDTVADYVQALVGGMAFTPISIAEFELSQKYAAIGSTVNELTYTFETSPLWETYAGYATRNAVVSPNPEGSFTETTEFVLTVTGKKSSDIATAKASLIFCYPLYYGASTDEPTLSSFEPVLVGEDISGTYEITTGENEYMWFILPKDYDIHKFYYGANVVNFDLIKEEEGYNFYRSIQNNLGKINIDIK